ncbi:DUF5082 family protein [Terrilactibacillus sp. S3-3]|nr:DUF5082 family protein [Terrilactibacillus sp. S3-3]
MMDAAGKLDNIFSALSHQSAVLEDKIERLRKANQQIGHNQKTFLRDSAHLVKPGLADDWTGKRANGFQKERKSALKQMKKQLTTTLDSYQESILFEIGKLELEKGALLATAAMAHEAGNVLKKGEEAEEALTHRLQTIERRLF